LSDHATARKSPQSSRPFTWNAPGEFQAVLTQDATLPDVNTMTPDPNSNLPPNHVTAFKSMWGLFGALLGVIAGIFITIAALKVGAVSLGPAAVLLSFTVIAGGLVGARLASK
jgi:hypothetical protein